MHRILVVSDTHGSLSSWEEIEKHIGFVDEIYHLGDVLYHGPRNPLPNGYNPAQLAKKLKERKSISYVRGNCDADVDLLVLENDDMPKIAFITLNDFKVILLHGEDIHTDEQMLQLLERYNATILAYGHTHIPRLEVVRSKILFNPGSPSLPKMNHPPTVGLIELTERLRIAIYEINGTLCKEIFL
ncbi:phosphodiesterase [Pseudothermotoga sp. U03pept]|uniref:phosphodiesterase n=1 Tax=Pseudothermotoga sp. U03pept TaxID=3447012 RepID=UPI003F0699D3